MIRFAYTVQQSPGDCHIGWPLLTHLCNCLGKLWRPSAVALKDWKKGGMFFLASRFSSKSRQSLRQFAKMENEARWHFFWSQTYSFSSFPIYWWQMARNKNTESPGCRLFFDEFFHNLFILFHSSQICMIFFVSSLPLATAIEFTGMRGEWRAFDRTLIKGCIRRS